MLTRYWTPPSPFLSLLPAEIATWSPPLSPFPAGRAFSLLLRTRQESSKPRPGAERGRNTTDDVASFHFPNGPSFGELCLVSLSTSCHLLPPFRPDNRRPRLPLPLAYLSLPLLPFFHRRTRRQSLPPPQAPFDFARLKKCYRQAHTNQTRRPLPPDLSYPSIGSLLLFSIARSRTASVQLPRHAAEAPLGFRLFLWTSHRFCSIFSIQDNTQRNCSSSAGLGRRQASEKR